MSSRRGRRKRRLRVKKIRSKWVQVVRILLRTGFFGRLVSVVKSPNPSALLLVRAGAAIGALIFFFYAKPLQACLQGYRFPPPKLLVPVLPPVRLNDAAKFDPPKIEPVKLEGLFAPPPVEAEEADHETFARYVREFEARPAGPASFEDTTDYAVALVHLGRVRPAIDVLLTLEKQRPGAYTTAANLGTACELSGELEAAVTWIGRGIERNPQSHQGTEWLHLAILRAKINLQTDATWLSQHTVLEGNENRPAAEVARAIEYQLHERLHFVKPTDAVVCDLFYQAARLATGENVRVKRAEWLRESLRFGDWRRPEAEALLKS
jgi:hypothetical protein